MHRKFTTISLSLLLLGYATAAFAHAVVKPSQTGIGQFTTFTLGVPVERDVPTVGVRLVVPDGLQYVSPNVKPGWKIEVKRESSQADAPISEISWTGGVIPAGLRDDFIFSAKVPAAATTLAWKVYQTYQDRSVVSWDQSPATPQPQTASDTPDFSSVGPYSQTAVVNDLANAPAAGVASSAPQLPLILSVVALVISFAALRRK